MGDNGIELENGKFIPSDIIILNLDYFPANLPYRNKFEVCKDGGLYTDAKLRVSTLEDFYSTGNINNTFFFISH